VRACDAARSFGCTIIHHRMVDFVWKIPHSRFFFFGMIFPWWFAKVPDIHMEDHHA
jgi:hypothetical protein